MVGGSSKIIRRLRLLGDGVSGRTERAERTEPRVEKEVVPTNVRPVSGTPQRTPRDVFRRKQTKEKSRQVNGFTDRRCKRKQGCPEEPLGPRGPTRIKEEGDRQNVQRQSYEGRVEQKQTLQGTGHNALETSGSGT